MRGRDPYLGREILGGQFRIVERIGSGGMGAVYKADQPAMGRFVAIKILHSKFSGRADLVSRFRREARAMSHLSHPNTARVFLYGTLEDGAGYIVMEHLEGQNLGQVVRQQGPMDPERAVNVLVQVCGALEEAHRAGIVHRDLKPENVFLTTQGGIPDFPKVLDFGLAKVTEREMRPGSVMLTQEGMVFGTPEFMSPEQAQGKKLDGRSDIYSLAVILFELLTGKLPFSAKQPMEYLTLHINARPMKLSERAPTRSFPDALQAVLDRALAKKPDERFQSAAEFSAALRASLQPYGVQPSGSGVHAMGGSGAYATAPAYQQAQQPQQPQQLQQAPPPQVQANPYAQYGQQPAVDPSVQSYAQQPAQGYGQAPAYAGQGQPAYVNPGQQYASPQPGPLPQQPQQMHPGGGGGLGAPSQMQQNQQFAAQQTPQPGGQFAGATPGGAFAGATPGSGYGPAATPVAQRTGPQPVIGPSQRPPGAGPVPLPSAPRPAPRPGGGGRGAIYAILVLVGVAALAVIVYLAIQLVPRLRRRGTRTQATAALVERRDEDGGGAFGLARGMADAAAGLVVPVARAEALPVGLAPPELPPAPADAGDAERDATVGDADETRPSARPSTLTPPRRVACPATVQRTVNLAMRSCAPEIDEVQDAYFAYVTVGPGGRFERVTFPGDAARNAAFHRCVVQRLNGQRAAEVTTSGCSGRVRM